MSEAMETAIPIVIQIPDALGLSEEEKDRLERKWEKDLMNAAGGAAAKSKVKVVIKIVVKD